MDLNNVPRSVLSTRLEEWDPEGLQEDPSVTDLAVHYQEVASRVVDLRIGAGLFRDYSELSQAGLGPEALKAIEENSYLGNFVVLSVESVGPKVGQEMQERAWNAVFFSLLGILAYITIRFKFVHGLAAIAALFHDVLITVGALSLTDRELTLTVVAALLTLVGYSINDTIVVFDRLRENEVRMRRSSFHDRINASINQILNRTIMTSGSTFVALLAPLPFGRTGAQQLLLCPGHRYNRRDLLVHRRRQPHRRGLAQVQGVPEQLRLPLGRIGLLTRQKAGSSISVVFSGASLP